MNSITGLGVIENEGPNHLRGYLKEHIKSAKVVDIAVAFVTHAGLLTLLPALKKASMNGHVRLLTGLYQCFTEPEALCSLLAAQIDTKGRMSVRLSTNLHFHWKAYFLLKGQKATAIIGSSNLTDDGLTGSGELNAVLSLRRNSSEFRSLYKPFEEEWKQARDLNKEQIKQYIKARPKIVRIATPSISLKEILGNRRKAVAVDNIEPKYWRDWISGFASKKTEDVISEETNWDKRGYHWYGSRESQHSKGDRIILFDFTDRCVHLVQIVSTTHTLVSTPDGRYFTAYQQVRGSHRRKIGSRMYTELKAAALITGKSDLEQGRNLKPAVFKRFKQALDL